MDKVIRVLALDDDNHDSMFATEEGETFENARFLLEKLGKPHSETYDIRGFCLIDYVGPAEKLDDALAKAYGEGLHDSFLERYQFAPEFDYKKGKWKRG